MPKNTKEEMGNAYDALVQSKRKAAEKIQDVRKKEYEQALAQAKAHKEYGMTDAQKVETRASAHKQELDATAREDWNKVYEDGKVMKKNIKGYDTLLTTWIEISSLGELMGKAMADSMWAAASGPPGIAESAVQFAKDKLLRSFGLSEPQLDEILATRQQSKEAGEAALEELGNKGDANYNEKIRNLSLEFLPELAPYTGTTLGNVVNDDGSLNIKKLATDAAKAELTPENFAVLEQLDASNKASIEAYLKCEGYTANTEGVYTDGATQLTSAVLEDFGSVKAGEVTGAILNNVAAQVAEAKAAQAAPDSDSDHPSPGMP